MATFVDSELAASAGFADTINDAPGIKSRISAARIVLEKADHAERVLEVMAEFGVDTARYEGVHPWAARLERDADIGASRQGGDMRLSVFHYPLRGWIDAVVMNVLQGAAAVIQLREFSKVSYQPLAEVYRSIAPREARHYELGREGLVRIAASEEGRKAARASIAYWTPRVEAGFGPARSTRFDTHARFGLRHRPNAELLADWRAETGRVLAELDLT
jgi:ring-1,2-phenylacetyl-CoA epoxidase subunit PaaA